MAQRHDTPGRVAKHVDRLASEGAPETYQPASRLYDREVRGLELNLGLACQSQCVFCMSGRAMPAERRFLPLARARAEIDRARAAGCGALGFLGGEPTLYKSLVTVVRHARAAGFDRITIATNGLRLADAAYARTLAGAGLTRCTLSLHSHRAELEDRLTGIPGAFARKVAAVRNLVALRDAGLLPHGVAINALVMRPNLRHLPAMTRAFRALGVRDVRFNSMRREGRALDHPDLLPRFRDVTPQLLRLVEANERRPGLTVSFGDFPHCVLPWPLLVNPALFRAYVGEHHDLVTDVSLSYAPPRDEVRTTRFNWQDYKLADLKLKPAACAGCRLGPGCEGVWRSYVEVHGTGEIRAVSA
jgi:MoaA/NifB/PqqE/SkfB family radical SAM enzyme